MKRGIYLLLLLCAFGAHAQQVATSFESSEVAPGIHMVSGVGGFGGGNMAILVGEQHVAMIDDSRRRVKALVDAGESEEAVVSAKPLHKYHDRYDWSFITTERMTRTLYRDLAAGG